MTQLKTIPEVLDKYMPEGWNGNIVEDLESIIDEIIGEDDEPRNTIEHSRRNFLRSEQRIKANKALGKEQ